MRVFLNNVLLIRTMASLEKEDVELVNEAKKILNLRKSSYSKTGCALRTSSGKVFSAVNVRVRDSAPCSICAEQAVIGKAISEGYNKFDCIVAVGDWKSSKVEVIAPCGMCREFIRQFGNSYIIIKDKNSLVKRRLDTLIPVN